MTKYIDFMLNNSNIEFNEKLNRFNSRHFVRKRLSANEKDYDRRCCEEGRSLQGNCLSRHQCQGFGEAGNEGPDSRSHEGFELSSEGRCEEFEEWGARQEYRSDHQRSQLSVLHVNRHRRQYQ